MRPSHIVKILLVASTLIYAVVLLAQDTDRFKAGVVKIVSQADGKRKIGTGFIIKLERDIAYIVTAAHVVEGDSAPEVSFFTRQSAPVRAEVRKIEGGDPRGLALLAVRGEENLPSGVLALQLESSISPQGGDQVMAIGFPRSGGAWALSTASVAAREGRDLILSGAVDEGNSGGPIVKNGKVVGVVMGSAGQFVRAAPAALIRLTLDGWQEVAGPGIAATPDPPGQDFSLPTQLAKSKIAFTATNPSSPFSLQLYLMNADGSNQVPLINDSNKKQVPLDCHDGTLPETDSPSWSPDGSKIAFEVRVWGTEPGECTGSGHAEIFVINSDGSGARQVTKSRASNLHPAWSPDGNKIAFASQSFGAEDVEDGIYVMNLDGSNRTRLTKNQRARYSYPEWSPHGTSIAFVSDSEDGAAIHVTNVDGTNQRRLTNPADVIRGLAWSPDGKKIAFAWASERGHSEIYVIDAGGANAKRLTSNKSRGSDHPTWSPDGSKIAYVSGQIVGQGEIYLMNPDGSNSFPLSDDPKQPSSSVGNVRWSPSPRK